MTQSAECPLTLPFNLLHNHSNHEESMPILTDIDHLPLIASGEKAKARDILAAIRTLAQIEQAQRPATPEERQMLAPLRRLRPGRPVDLSRSGHRPLQGRGLAGARRGAAGAADARGVRQRQAHHLQRLLHLADRHPGDARGPRPPGRAGGRHRPGAGLRHRQLS